MAVPSVGIKPWIYSLEIGFFLHQNQKPKIQCISRKKSWIFSTLKLHRHCEPLAPECISTVHLGV